MAKFEKQSFGKYYLTAFANGIKRFTQSKWMVAIVNGFIAVMPIIITASIFTLLSALPEMVMTVAWGKDWKDHINYEAFSQYQTWASVISNWSMGIIGMFATAAIARNLAVELNNKLPFERRMNENMVFFAAISVYFMLSVIEFTVGDSDAWKVVMPDHTGRAIFVDGLAAQGILPGIIIGLTLPYVFYIAYKRNWTIRLPKQVPQTICQAFLAIIPLFLTFAIFGSIGFGFNKLLGEPILFWLFEKIQAGLTGNEKLNNSYGLICIYTLMEGGFWFLGVHPEPVHAVMRATFWFDNIAKNAAGAGNIFIEPLMYGYGAMGGSGSTLMLPLLCLICCRSTQMKVTGKTAVLPIVFQVNEPALFGVPTILNPLFAFPMIFTGMINDVLFKAFADGFANSFHAGSLYLPWSTPYFLQTALPTPTSWVPWVFNLVALAVCTLTYLPAVLLQDKQYLKEESRKLGINVINFKPLNGLDIIKNKLFASDSLAKRNIKVFKKQQKLEVAKLLANATSEEQKQEIIWNAKIALANEKNKQLLVELNNLIKFADRIKADKLAVINRKKQSAIDKVDDLIASKQAKLDKKKAKLVAKIDKQKNNITTFKNIIKTTEQKNATKKQLWIDTHPNEQFQEPNKVPFAIRLAEKNIEKANKKIADYKQIQKVGKQRFNLDKKLAKLDAKKNSNENSANIDAQIEKLTQKQAKLNANKNTGVSIKSKVNDIDVEYQKNLLKIEKLQTVAYCRAVLLFNRRSNNLLSKYSKQAKYEVKKDKLNQQIAYLNAHITHIQTLAKNAQENDLLKSEKKVASIKNKISKVEAKLQELNANPVNSSEQDINLKKNSVPSKYAKYELVNKFTLLESINQHETEVKAVWPSIKESNKAKLLQGINPWASVDEQQQAEPVEQEKKPAKKTATKKTPAKSSNGLDPNKKYQVLVLCLGAGSSAVLANAINAGLKQAKITNIKAAALAWGQHEAALGSSDLVILSPQLGSHANNLSKQAIDKGFKLLACRGRDYIELTKNPASAVEAVIKQLTSK